MVAFGRGRAFVASLMRRVTEQGKVAGRTAPPEIGINNTPLDYEYIRLNRVLYHKMNLGPGVRRTPHPNSPASPWIARTTRAAP
jgi:hypothetical protein